MRREDFYDHAGLMTTGTGTMFSTHVGDDLHWGGFAEGVNTPNAVSERAAHPAFGPSMQLIGFVFLVLVVLYMDKRLKVPFLP